MTSSASATRPVVLRCNTSSDFLATLPFMMGYTVQNSIVIALFRGSQAAQAMRVDLPAADMAHTATGVEATIASVVSRLPAVTSVALVVYTEEAFTISGDAPRLMLLRWLERSLEREGIAVKDVCCVAADAWASLHSPEARTGGRPLDELTESMASFEARRHTRAPLRELSDLGALPPVNTELSEGLQRAMSICAPMNPETLTLEHSKHLLREIDEALTTPLISTTSASFAAQATLLRSLNEDVLWLVTVFSCFLRPDSLARPSGAHADTPDPDALLEHLHAFIRQHRDLDVEARLQANLTRISAERIPEIRLRSIISSLTVLAANAPDSSRPGVMTLLSWAWWMSGATTPADRLLTALEEENRAGRIGHAVRDTIDEGPPLWLYSPARQP